MKSIILLLPLVLVGAASCHRNDNLTDAAAQRAVKAYVAEDFCKHSDFGTLAGTPRWSR